MRNRKSLLTLSLLVLVLILGVGYATVSSIVLSINGTASVQPQDLNVSFEGTVTPSSAKAKGNAAKGSTVASITVTNLELNEIVYVDYVVQNTEADIDALITGVTVTNPKSDFFEVTTDIDPENPKEVLADGGTVTVRVSVKLIQTPVTAANSTVNIKVDLDVEPEKN